VALALLAHVLSLQKKSTDLIVELPRRLPDGKVGRVPDWNQVGTRSDAAIVLL
jgi:hypothetical protein